MDWQNFSIKMALKLVPALLVITSFTAIMIGLIFHAISINEIKFSNPPATKFKPGVIIDDQDKDLVWFLQVTDLHLSNRGNFDRETDFQEFSKNYVDIIKPDVVLVTGDITDGRQPNTTFGTGPQLDEWLAYRNAVVNSGALTKTKWLDIRGNHDNFNVYRPKDPENPYIKYSITGKNYPRNYYEILTKEGKNYTFIGVDEVQTPGLKIPFNFIGLVKDEDVTELKKFKKFANDLASEYTIWFAHYPTSSIASPNEGLRNIIDGPYLCGHYHTIANWVTQMHSTQQPGYIEAELGDWKYNRRIRLASIDHQLFNFVDVGFREFPIALMTNPKKPEYLMPKYEPIDRIAKSTHIRVLAFSNASISSVQISIDGGPRRRMKGTSIGSPLYILEWEPAAYSSGYHKAEIFVEDSSGSNRTYTQGFSLDGSKENFALGARILIRAYFKSYVMTIFFFIVVVCTLPLMALRSIVYRHQESILKKHYRGTFLYNLHLLCGIKRMFIPLIMIPIWMAIGPHFIGYMVDEAIGVCFVWGVLIDSTFIHTGITYNVSSIFLLFIHVPEVILLTYQVRNSYKSIRHLKAPVKIMNSKMIVHILLIGLQCFMGSLLYSAYGAMSYFTSFPYLWCIFIYSYCWYQCCNFQLSDFTSFIVTPQNQEEQSLTGQEPRLDDRSSASDTSTC